MHRRLLLAALAVACACAAARAQQEAPAQACKLTLEQSPALRGFRLGMSLEQLKARYPGVPLMEQQPGLTNASLVRGGFPGADTVTFEGVNNISLGFLDGRLVSLWVGYDNRVQWRGVEQFASRVAELLKLPDAWVSEPGADTYGMKCVGFQIRVSPNSINLTIPGYQEVLRARREQREEERRRAFKP